MKSSMLGARTLGKLAPIALIVLSPYPILSARAQSAPPVKMSTAESDKYITYRDNSCMYGGMKMRRLFGSVTFEFTVTAEGNVVDVTPVGGALKDNPAIGKLGKDCIPRWRYRPYTVNGAPTAMRTTADFKL